ncbi:hypothetical protein K438DRAFT_1956177 [Mycena galopus ATCC 62051]|nr:hypothetical protein K438DRAFT_1956177 [Mycena galopus ATCC 62051]
MIIAAGDNKGAPEPSARAELTNGEPSRAPSPPPAYSSSPARETDDAGAIQIIVQRQDPELPSAFRPPSPSSFPHPHPHTRFQSSGPTPLFAPATPSAQPSYPYYDPRSPYSLALADQRAWDRFRGAFLWNIGIFVFLWCLGLIRLDV